MPRSILDNVENTLPETRQEPNKLPSTSASISIEKVKETISPLHSSASVKQMAVGIETVVTKCGLLYGQFATMDPKITRLDERFNVLEPKIDRMAEILEKLLNFHENPIPVCHFSEVRNRNSATNLTKK